MSGLKVNKTRYTPEQVQMGVAAIDVNSGKSTISQFSSQYYNDPTTYDDIERQQQLFLLMRLLLF